MIPGLGGTTVLQQIHVVQLVSSPTVPSDVYAAVGSPTVPVVYAIVVEAPAVRASMLCDGFEPTSKLFLFCRGHQGAAGGAGGSQNQISRHPSPADFTSGQHVPGGGGGAGQPVGAGGLGALGTGGDNVAPAGPNGSPGTLLTGGAGDAASSQAQEIDGGFYEPFWQDARDVSTNPDFSGVDGADAITLSCQMEIYNTGIIAGGGGGGAAGFFEPSNYTFFPNPQKVGSCAGGDAGKKPTYDNVGDVLTADQFFETAEFGSRYLAGKNGEAGFAVRYTNSQALATFAIGGVADVDVFGEIGE